MTWTGRERAAAALWIALALAACGSGDSLSPGEGDNGAPAARAPAPATSAVEPPAPAEAAALPATFQGRWDAGAAACVGTGGAMRLIVEPDRMRFHESIARVERVRHRSDGGTDVDLAFTGEGENWTETRILRLLPDGRLSIETGEGSAVRTRCG